MAEMIRLRELPGVASITDLCRNPRNFEYPTSSYTQEKINEVSVSLFGITQYQTTYEYACEVADDDDDDSADEESEDEFDEEDFSDLRDEPGLRERLIVETAAAEAEHEKSYHPTKLPWPAGEPFWHALGWDISDGQGNELFCAHCFDRQIIAVAGSLVEGAVLSLDGKRGETDERSAQMLTEQLQREAAAFIAARRRR